MDYKRVLILHFTNGMSGREIAETTGDKKTTVNEFLKRFRECEELSYPLSEDVTNEFIAGCLYKKAGNPVNSDLYRDFDPEEVHRALAKKADGYARQLQGRRYRKQGLDQSQREQGLSVLGRTQRHRHHACQGA